jgi:hypothetical protein
MILKQNIKNQIIVSGYTWSMILILFAGWWYFNYDPVILLIGGLFHLIFTIPALYLHIEYYLRNKGEVIEINYNEIIVRKNGEERKYDSSLISKVIVYKSASLDKWGIPLTAMEYYRLPELLLNLVRKILLLVL